MRFGLSQAITAFDSSGRDPITQASSVAVLLYEPTFVCPAPVRWAYRAVLSRALDDRYWCRYGCSPRCRVGCR